MKNTVRLHMDLCRVLCDIENSGIKVNKNKLQQIEKSFRDEHSQLEVDLQNAVKSLCGDTPINLSSAEDRSKLFYSMVVKDKKSWKVVFDLGTEVKAGKRKKKFVKDTHPKVFKEKY